MNSEDSIQSLREALRLSPTNIPLRLHLAKTLLQLSRADEAETEFRAGLSQDRDNAELKIGLATAFYEQGKYSHALVMLSAVLPLASW